MKKLLLVHSLLLIACCAFSQNIGIGTTTPDVNAALEIKSAGKGILMPRTSTVTRSAMANVSKGMLVYDTSHSSFYFHDGSKWRPIADRNMDSLLIDYSATPAITANMSSGTTVTSAQSGILYDNGGPAGNYANNSNNEYVISRNPLIISDSVVGYKVIIEQMNLESPYDSLEIISDPGYKKVFTGTTTGTYYFPGGGGALTFRFRSNAVNNLAGFKIIWTVLTVSTELSDPAPLYGWYFNAKKLAGRAGIPAGNDWSEDSLGKFSFAFGYNARATGNHALAFSGGNARGAVAVSMGYASEAFGAYSTAIGSGYITPNGAYGYASVAIGMQNATGGDYSASVGTNNNVSGNYAFATGIGNGINSDYGFALGHNNNVAGQYATALGYRTTANGTSGVTMGRFTQAPGYAATAIGDSSIASGILSFASGFRTTANGISSTAMGKYTQASGYAATAMGDSTDASGIISFASGYRTIASGLRSTAMGSNSTASGDFSTATGYLTVANADFSTAMGSNSTASNSYSTAMGYQTTASGNASVAMGATTTASATASIAMGAGTIASANFSTATGSGTTASGSASTSMGSLTTASGSASTSIGLNTIARGYAGTVIGMYNNAILASAQTSVNASTPLFIIGNGDDNSNRNNAMVVLKTGNVGLGTNVPDANLHIKHASGGGLILENANDNNKWRIYSASGDNNLTFYNDANTEVADIDDVTGTYNAISDGRLKKNVQSISSILPLVLQLNPSYYQFNWQQPDDQKQIGFIAQEAYKLFPELVSYDKEKDLYKMNYAGFSVVAIKAIQEQQKEIEELKARLEKLEAIILKK